MRGSMNRDGGAGEMGIMMILRGSVLMGRRLSLKVNMIGIGGIDILIGIGVVRGAEAGQESTGESEHAGNLERCDRCSIRDRRKGFVNNMKPCICAQPGSLTVTASSMPRLLANSGVSRDVCEGRTYIRCTNQVVGW